MFPWQTTSGLPRIADFTPYYRLLPVTLTEKVPDSVFGDELLSLEQLIELFPRSFEGYCILAFIALADEAAGDNPDAGASWTGASWASVDRWACRLSRLHTEQFWRRIGHWLTSFGRRKELTRADWIAWWLHDFRRYFWRSMRRLIDQGLVRAEVHRIGDREWEVFFPTDRLVRELNARLAHGVPAINP